MFDYEAENSHVAETTKNVYISFKFIVLFERIPLFFFLHTSNLIELDLFTNSSVSNYYNKCIKEWAIVFGLSFKNESGIFGIDTCKSI